MPLVLAALTAKVYAVPLSTLVIEKDVLAKRLSESQVMPPSVLHITKYESRGRPLLGACHPSVIRSGRVSTAIRPRTAVGTASGSLAVARVGLEAAVAWASAAGRSMSALNAAARRRCFRILAPSAK
ncbi:MAG: hypothetical protein JW384_01126 [Nitrosomonadaceae bacterium]|nr:hypothetical protein [Nitrosomonadaceae bacterium]